MKKMLFLGLVLSAALMTVCASWKVLYAQNAPGTPVLRETDTKQKASDLLEEEKAGKKNEFINTLWGYGMWPLWLCSIVLVSLVWERFKALRQVNIIDSVMVEDVITLVSGNEMQKARERCQQSSTVVGKAWGQGFHEHLLGGVSIHESLTNATFLALKPLKRNLQAISTLAVISPLFGLLGTVLGMIVTFYQISATGGADKAELAGGIGLALFTTAGGLIVAIPAIMFGRFFSGRLNGFAEQAEAAINRINYRYTNVQAQKRDGKGEEPAGAAAGEKGDGGKSGGPGKQDTTEGQEKKT